MGLSWTPNASRNVYISPPRARHHYVPPCSIQDTLSRPALPHRGRGQRFTSGPGTGQAELEEISGLWSQTVA